MNRSLLLVMCDVLVLSAMSLSDGGFDGDEKRMQGSRDVTAEYNATTAGLAAATNALAKAQEAVEEANTRADDADKKRKDSEEKALKAQNDAEAAKEGEAIAKSEAEVARANEQQAKNEAEKAKEGQARAEKGKADAEKLAAAAKADAEDIDNRYGKPARARDERIGRIHASAYHVAVKFRDGETDRFYSPIINIDDEAFVVARYEGKKLNSIDSVEIRRGRYGASYIVDAAYYLKESNKLDILFLRIQNPDVPLPMLTLGENSQEPLRYWISRESGAVTRAPIVQPSPGRTLHDYVSIKPGDVLVDSGTASIVCLALSSGSWLDWFSAKKSYVFDHKITHFDLWRWRGFDK